MRHQKASDTKFRSEYKKARVNRVSIASSPDRIGEDANVLEYKPQESTPSIFDLKKSHKKSTSEVRNLPA